jgi:hypothetical protein
MFDVTSSCSSEPRFCGKFTSHQGSLLRSNPPGLGYLGIIPNQNQSSFTATATRALETRLGNQVRIMKFCIRASLRIDSVQPGISRSGWIHQTRYKLLQSSMSGAINPQKPTCEFMKSQFMATRLPSGKHLHNYGKIHHCS